MKNRLDFFKGKMADRIRSFNWTDNTLMGPISGWNLTLINVLCLVIPSPAPLLILWGKQGYMLYNDACADFARGQNYSLLGMKAENALYHENPFLRSSVEKCFSGESVSIKQATFKFYPEDDDGIFVNVHCSPIYGSEGEIEGIMIFINDVTKQVNAEEALRRSVEKYDTAMKAPELVGTWDWYLTSDIVLSDPNFATTFSVPDEKAMKGTGIGEYIASIHPEDKERVKEDIHKAIKTGKRFSSEYRLLRDNKVIWILAQGQCYYDNKGNPTKFPGVGIDITKRKKVEENVKKSEELFRNLAEQVPMMVFIADTEANLIYTNSQWLHYTGQSYDEALTEKGWAKVVHPDDMDNLMKDYKSAVGQREKYTLEVRLRRKDGQYRSFLYTGGPVYFSEDKFVGYVGTGIDITERKESERAIELKNAQLLRINNDLDNFIYTASHDLKAPVINLEGLFEAFVSEVELTEELNKIKNLMKESFKRFKSTIQDLTEISKIQKGEFEEQEILSFAAITNEIKADLTYLIKKHNAEIFYDFKVEAISFSKKNLKSILYNFISNSIKYSSPHRKPSIKISTEKSFDNVILIVEDNGLGISKADQAKVFKMFKRMHTHVEGSGVGLYIVKKIIDNAGGKIEIESEVDKGTRFKIFLPIEE